MKQYLSPLISNSSICASIYLLEFILPGIEERPEAGQFFTIKINDLSVPLLRRPFAFSGFNSVDNRAFCIYEVRGAGTNILSSLGKGALLDIIGPLGKPFPFPKRGERALLVAGGIGLGPIIFLADSLRECGIEYRLVFGCGSAPKIPHPVLTGRNALICTDDGSFGFHGNTVDFLKSIATSISDDEILYCCGPEAMLIGCCRFAADRRLRCFVSVEQVMACGVGACMGCTVKVRDDRQFVRVCKEGPVFECGEIAWE